MNLDLTVKYTCIDKKYIPLLTGGGCTCDNCGRLIANIATVRSANGVYNIGFDCLENILLNNNLLEGFNQLEYDQVKKQIKQVLRIAKVIKEQLSKYPQITGLLFDEPGPNYITFYWLQNNETKSRNNDYFKAKDINQAFFVETLKNCFPKLTILK